VCFKADSANANGRRIDPPLCLLDFPPAQQFLMKSDCVVIDSNGLRFDSAMSLCEEEDTCAVSILMKILWRSFTSQAKDGVLFN
jgi:hypothetical protein